jgi:uncharacterized protein (TIGR02271 family)
MKRQPARDEPVEGMDVNGADGAKVGTIVALGATYLVVEKGFFFPTDYYIPLAAVARVDLDDNAVWLTVDKDAALHQGWDVAPEAGATRTDAAMDATATAHAVDWTGTPAASARRADVVTDQADAIVVPVHEEELTATARPVERGAVRIAKDVVAEDRVLEVPVTEEQVHVQRRAVDRPVEPADAVFEGGVIEVPVRGEDVQLQKRMRVAEEIEVTKDAVQRTEQVRGTVRREQVRIVDDVAEGDVGVVDADEAVIEPGAAASDADAGPRL